MANPFRTAAARRRSILGLDGTGSAGLTYSGAQFTRLTQDWVWAPIASADEEARWDIARIRARARELRRNNPYVARFAEMVGENVIGHDGMKLQARVANAEGKPDIKINDTIEEAWAEWCMPEAASVDGQLSFVDFEALAVMTEAIDGEALVRMIPGFPNEFGFALQALDIDLLDHTYNRPASGRQNEIRMGVEIDAWGRPVQYWLWTRHPYDLNGSGDRDREPVPADEIIHLHRPGRAGQTRSVSWLAPVLLPLKMLGGFVEAELIAARTAAAAAGLLIQDPESVDDPDSPAGEGNLTLEVEPGSFTIAPAGITDLKQFAPNHPNIQTGEFVKTIVRWIAGGVSCSYNALGNDLESVNYSSIRAGEIAARDHWRTLQRHTYTHFHRRVYGTWLKYAMANGAIALPSRNVSRWFAHRWMPRGWAWVDPLKDITAAAAALQLKMSSRGRFLAQEGRDLEETFRDIRDERALADAYGIELIDVIGQARVSEDTTPTGDVSGDTNASDETNDGSDGSDGTSDADAARALDVLMRRMGRRTNGHSNNGHSPNGRH